MIFPDNITALAFCRSLGPIGIPVDVLATNAATPGQYSRYARGLRCPDPRISEEGFIEFLVALAREEQDPPLLFCSDDRSLLLCERHRAVLEKHFLLAFPAWDCLEQLVLKDSLYLRGLDGIATPATVLIESEDDLALASSRMLFPLLLKPTLRCLREGGEISSPPFEKVFGEKAVRVNNKEELALCSESMRKHQFAVLAQEEIPGGIDQLYTVGIYAGRDGEIKAAWTGHKLAQVPADFGDALVVEAEWKPELLVFAERMIRATGFYGIADLEFKLDPRDGNYKLLDINTRPWGWIGFLTLCGVNLPYAAYCDLTGLGAPVQRQFPERRRWITPRGLLLYLLRSVRKGGSLLASLGVLGNLRGLQSDMIFGARDFLFRMFLSPAYWRDSLRQASHWIQNIYGLRQQP